MSSSRSLFLFDKEEGPGVASEIDWCVVLTMERSSVVSSRQCLSWLTNNPANGRLFCPEEAFDILTLHNKVLLGYPQSITCTTANAMEEPPWKKIRLSLERPYKNDDGEPIPVLLDITAEGTHIYEPYVDFEV